MDESTFQTRADEVYRKLGDRFENVDAEIVDCEIAGDVVSLSFKSGQRCVVNTQRPTRQIWLAANARAWHFSYDEAKKQWLDDKGQGHELFATIASIVKELGGIDLEH